MNLEEKIGQRFLVGFPGQEAPAYLLDWLRAGRVGGVILFARNIDNPAQVARLSRSLHETAKFPLLIGIDQEGGTVARLRQGFCESPGALALSAAAEGPTLAEQVDQVLAFELRALGINWNFAPALDITYNPANPSIGTRSFGADAARVAEMGAAAVRGFQGAGVAACAKHFPGLGRTVVDTHLALPTLDTPTDQLLAQDMSPFRAVIQAGVASVMTTHTIFAALDSRLPSTLSPVIIQRLLREEFGFRGVVSSDCMEMKAIADNFTPAETAILGAQAGLDVMLFSHTRAVQESAYEGLLDAARRGQVRGLDAANERIMSMKQTFPATQPEIRRIRQPDHVDLMLQAARAGIVVVQGDGRLPAADEVTLVEFASQLESGILEHGGVTGFAAQMRQFLPDLRSVTFGQEPYEAETVRAATALARSAQTLILATRNAHLNADQLSAARHLAPLASQVILVCLRNPYDAQVLSGAQPFRSIICTCGDSTPSLHAAAEVLNGVFAPTGRLPVPLQVSGDRPGG